jgi:hypothetical protein
MLGMLVASPLLSAGVHVAREIAREPHASRQQQGARNLANLGPDQRNTGFQGLSVRVEARRRTAALGGHTSARIAQMFG